MQTSDSQKRKTPQQLLRGVLELCADCDTCRFLMDEDCAFFPELYRLWDLEQETGVASSEAQLRHLAGLCTLCGLCPCPKIPVDVMEAKSRYVDREGQSALTRLLTDVPRLARLCGTFAPVVKALQSNRALAPLLHRATGLHPHREFPAFAPENFFQWAETKGLTRHRVGERQVAYFAGCTAGYLFPEVGRAVVEVLERNGLTVYVPPQQCCGLPHFAEGDRTQTLQRARFNLEQLLTVAKAGAELICSCPSCGYFFKELIKERAVYSEAYQLSVNAGPDELKIPDTAHGSRRHKILKKSMYKDILKDDGYFSALDPMARVQLSAQLFDLGEYLLRLQAEGRFVTQFRPLPERTVYFAPCHQREQKLGRPYLELLALIPELSVEPVGETNCCGMGGNFGFKADFHDQSLAIGDPLLTKIRSRNPQAIITDCLSCRLQFQHSLAVPVFHPIEILARAYRGADADV